MTGESVDTAIGRNWQLVDVDGAHALLDNGPAFVTLADAKHQLFPAARFADAAAFEVA